MRNLSIAAVLCAALAIPASATVTSTSNSVAYSCNSVTTGFVVPFAYLASSQILATLTPTGGVASPLVLTTDYTVKPSIAPSTGTLTLTTACPSGSTLTISRSIPLTQPQSFRTGNYQGPSHEEAFDRLAMEIQQVQSTVANPVLPSALTNATPVASRGGTTSLQLQDWLASPVNVKAFNAKGDGVTDDSVAIQAAHDSLPNTGGAIYFPRGSYLVRTTITSTKTNVRWFGEGVGAWGTDTPPTELFTDQAIIILDIGSATATNHGGHAIESLTFRDATGTALGAIRQRRMNHPRFQNVAARDFTVGYGIKMDGTGDASILPLVQGMKFRNNKFCIQTAGQVIRLSVIGGYCGRTTGLAGSIGIDWNSPGADGLGVYNTAIDGYENGVKIQGDAAQIQGRFEQAAGMVPHNAFVWIVSGTGNTVAGSYFQRGVNGVIADTLSSVRIGPNAWITLPSTASVTVNASSTGGYTVNEPQLSDFRVAQGNAVTTPLDFNFIGLTSTSDRHTRMVVKGLNGSVTGVLAAEQTAGAVNQVLVGSTTNSTVNLIRNSTTIAQLTTADFSVTVGLAPDGGGAKHLRVAGCATAASAGATCLTTVTWTTAFANASYTAVCMGDQITSGVPVNGGITGRTTTSVTFQTVAMTAAAAQYTFIACAAFHD